MSAVTRVFEPTSPRERHNLRVYEDSSPAFPAYFEARKASIPLQEVENEGADLA